MGNPFISFNREPNPPANSTPTLAEGIGSGERAMPPKVKILRNGEGEWRILKLEPASSWPNAGSYTLELFSLRNMRKLQSCNTVDEVLTFYVEYCEEQRKRHNFVQVYP